MQETRVPQQLRVGIVTESDTLSTQQQSVLRQLDKQGYIVDKLLVLDRVPEHERRSRNDGESIQLEQLLCQADLEDIDVLLCQDDQVQTFKGRQSL